MTAQTLRSAAQSMQNARYCFWRRSSGFRTEGAVLYSYMGVPCKDCMLELIQAGVAEIVCLRETYHDEISKDILREWIAKGGKFRIYDPGVSEK